MGRKKTMKGSALYYRLCEGALQEYKRASAQARQETQDANEFIRTDAILWQEYMSKLYDALNYYQETN
jgi:hypothetical protein